MDNHITLESNNIGFRIDRNSKSIFVYDLEPITKEPTNEGLLTITSEKIGNILESNYGILLSDFNVTIDRSRINLVQDGCNY